jgi:hypothetical protein
MNVSSSLLLRGAGLAALIAGMIFTGIQPIHPPDVVASVTTQAWAIITPLKTVMCLLFVLGITGIYAKQVNAAGWLGLAGYTLLVICWSLLGAFVFVETFVFPPLVASYPTFVAGVFGLFNGSPVATPLGVLPALWTVSGLAYMLGGLVFGVATVRAGVLPRAAGIVWAVASVLTPAAALLPHELQRLAGIPVGLAIAWLGLALVRASNESSPIIAAGASRSQPV